MKILVLDNYDSFTYNLVQYIDEILDTKVDVFRNDAISLEAVAAYDTIILSPGPGLPKDAGIMPDLLKTYAATKNIFGVCLGLQAIGEAFGAKLYNLDKVYHGVATKIQVLDPAEVLFDAVPLTFEAGRYHSWAIDKAEIPSALKVTAVDEFGEIMAISHESYNIKAVQFHPESVMTPQGKQMIANFFGVAFAGGRADLVSQKIMH